ncbi:MAG: VPS10 domain-containing protein [Longimicrobiales bacterium]
MRVCVTTLLLAVLLPCPAQPQVPPVAELFGALEFRSIGPAVAGGRIHDVEALPNDPATLYVGTASGGLWKSVNAGISWTSIFDDQPVSTFGDVTIAPSNPAIVWAGTGEQNNRQSTSYGNGVYRSTDAGATWTHLGLDETRHIGRVLVHPQDPDVAWVAALGNLWRPSAQRGVFKTTDAGRTWANVLFVDTLTGVVDMELDPADPNTLYAASYQRLRRAWGFNGGGPSSGIHKSTDGGETWQRLTTGLPAAPIGRIGLAVAQSRPGVVYATIEHAGEAERGVYRSDDGGASWRRVNSLNPRPMYYSKIFVDPTDAERVYVIAVDAYVSDDGGRTFRELPTRPTYDVGVHADHHTMWIDPGDPDHFYLAGDGGLHVTWDRGQNYEKIANLPIAQLYAIGADRRTPYNVYIGLQDNHSWMGPSATRHWIGIINDDWRQIGFGDGMYHDVDLDGWRYVYTTAQNGSAQRFDAVTGDRLEVRPTEPPGEDHRYDWVTPFVASQHTAGTVFLGGNRLFISRDHGATWSATPDLTKQIDRDTLFLMGVRGSERMLSKNDGESSFSEITTIAESPADASVLWVGTDDGNVQVSRDGGGTWTEVGRNLAAASGGPPPTTYVSRVTASAADPGRAYVALDAHRDGDFAPYLFRTDDFGRTWQARAAGLPPLGPVNDVVEHPDNPNLLFAGTEHHLFVSSDAGQSWQRFGANLPTTLYDDLLIHPVTNDLIAATHGRSVWILEDIAPLVEWTAGVERSAAHLFSVRPASIFQYWKDTSYRGQAAYAGENPPAGAILSYYVGGGEGGGGRGGMAADSVTLTVRNSADEVVRTLRGPGASGVVQRIVWDLRHELPFDVPAGEEPEARPRPPQPLGMRGPFVAPGTYQITLEANGATSTSSVLVEPDPLMPDLEQTDYIARERYMLELLRMIERIAGAAERSEGARARLEQLRDSLSAAGAPVSEPVSRLDSVTVLEDQLGLDRRFGGMRGQILGLYSDLNGSGVRQGSLYPPTPEMLDRKRRLEEALDAALTALERLTGS